MKASRFLAVALVSVFALAGAVPAQANFHQVRVNEVMLSNAGDSSQQFVEFADSPEPFPCPGPYELVAYNSSGAKAGEQDLSCGGTLQNRFNGDDLFYVATPTAPVAGDIALTVPLPTGAGSVCFTEGATESKVNCISWGCPTGSSGSSSSQQIPATGQSLQRQPSNSLNTANPTPNAPNIGGAATAVCSSSGGGGGGGGGAPGTGTTPPVATVAANPELSGKATQKLGSSISVTVACPNAPCLASAAGTISVPKLSKIYKIKANGVQIAQGAKATLKLKVSSKAMKAIKRALRKGKKIKAKITVAAKNTAGTTTAKKTVKLKK